MDYIVRGIKYMMGTGSTKVRVEVEGHVLVTDSTSKRSFILVKENEHSWKSKWMNTDDVIVKSTTESLASIFKATS